MINDIFMVGAISGVLANIPVNLLDYVLYRLGVNKIFVWHIAATVYIEKKDLHTPAGLIIGAAADYIMGGVKGVVLAYLIYFTGWDFYLFKGIAVGLLFWLICFGLILRLNIAGIDPVEPGTNLTHLSWHILLGVTNALLILQLGNFYSL